MRLILRKHKLADMAFGPAHSFGELGLTVSAEAAAGLFPGHPGLRLTGLHIARPWSSMRFGPVLDVVGMRCCDEGSAYPGITGPEPSAAARGLTVLDKAAVCVVSNLAGVQEGLIAMNSSWSPLSGLHMLVCVAEASPDEDRAVLDRELRQFQCRLAEELAGTARHSPPWEEEVLDWSPEPAGAGDLPRVGAVYFIQAQGTLRRTFVLGEPADDMPPRFMHPLEGMAGHVTSGNYVMPGNKTCTYIHQTAPVITELLARHGKSWRFSGVILAAEASSRQAKEKTARDILALARELKLDGVIVNQEGGGNADMDIMLACQALESEGIAAILLVNEFAGPDGRSPSLTEYRPEARCMVSCGNNDHLAVLPPVGAAPGFPMSIVPGADAAKELRLPLSRIYASTNQLGFWRISCFDR